MQQAARRQSRPWLRPPVLPHAAGTEPADEYPVAAEVARFIDRGEVVLAAFPELMHTYAQVPAALDRSAEGGPGLLLFLLMTCLLHRSSARARNGSPTWRWRASGRAPWRRLVPRTGRHPCRRCCCWPCSTSSASPPSGWSRTACTGAWFSGTDPQSRLGAAILTSVFAWRLYMFAFRVAMRPGLAKARLAGDGPTPGRGVRLRPNLNC